MRKQVLSEEFKRMQKLANIKEARFTNPDKARSFYADAEYYVKTPLGVTIINK